MKRYFRSLALIALMTVAFSAATTQASIVVIDDFAAGVNMTTLGGPTVVANDGPHAGVIGGYRQTNLVNNSGHVQAFYSAVATNTFSFDSLAGSTGVYTAVYSGLGGAGLNVNLLAGGLNRFGLDVLESNSAGSITISVEDTFGVTSSQLAALTTGVTGPINFFFSGFTSDLTSVKTITFTLAATSAGSDFTIGAIRAIPEPASICLIGLGSLLVLRRNRRRI